MIRFLSQLNPFARIADEARAETLARGSAVALVLGALVSAWGAIKIVLWPDEIRRLMTEGMAAQPHPDPEAARMAEAMIPGLMNTSAILGLLICISLLTLAFVQWRRLTRLIPAIFAALGLIGLVMMFASQAMVASGLAPDVPQPAAELLVNRVLNVIGLLLHVGGYRGARWLAQSRTA